MGVYAEPKSYSDGAALTETMLDEGRDYRAQFFNVDRLDSSNLQSGAVVEATIGTGAVSASKLASDSVTTVKILDANVTTAKLAALSVTQAKRAALGQQVSSSCGSFSTTSGSLTDITNLSVTITTTGRPVFIGAQADGSSTAKWGVADTADNDISATVTLKRDSTTIAVQEAKIISQATTTGSFQELHLPASSIWHIDVPAAGTYVYKLQMTSTEGFFSNAKLVAYEL